MGPQEGSRPVCCNTLSWGRSDFVKHLPHPPAWTESKIEKQGKIIFFPQATYL